MPALPSRIVIPQLPNSSILILPNAESPLGFTAHFMRAQSLGDEALVAWRPESVTSTDLYIFAEADGGAAGCALYDCKDALFEACPNGFVVTGFGYVKPVVAISHDPAHCQMPPAYSEPKAGDLAVIVGEKLVTRLYARDELEANGTGWLGRCGGGS